MARRCIAIGATVVCVALLGGCEFLESILDLVGAGFGNSGTGAIVSGRLEFHVAATITETGGTHDGTVETIFYSAGGTYDAATRTFVATWNGGDSSDTVFEARLSASEQSIEFFYARQTRSGVYGAWTYVHEIRGVDIPYSHSDGTSRYFVLTGTSARGIVDLFSYKAWSSSFGSEQSPVEWVSTPSALNGSGDDIITIRLDS